MGRPTTFTNELGEVQIYALCCPVSGEVRYIGKAKNAQRRLAGHLRDARRRHTPVYRWIRKLVGKRQLPLLKVLETVAADAWESAERRLISEYRNKARLLNLAAGGDQPFCDMETRKNNGRNNAKLRISTPLKAAIYRLKRDLSMDLKRGYCTEYAKAKMRQAAIDLPEVFGLWANI